MSAGKVHHWKHGWIPISPEAKAYARGEGPRPVTERTAGVLMNSIKEFGGFTWSPKKGLLEVGKDKGFAIAIPGTEHVVGKETVGGDYVSREDFAEGVANVIEKYSDQLNAGAVLGGWYSPERNEFLVELTQIFDPKDREGAIQAGKDRNQEAIFDLATGETINTGGTGDAPAKVIDPGVDTPVETELVEPMDPSHVAAAKFYTGPGYKPLNNSLRFGTPLNPAAAFYEQKLDEAIDRSRVSGSGATVFRGIQTWPGFPARFNPGDVYEDAAYMSTATDPNGQYGGDVKFVINVPPGARALDLYGQGLSHHMNEKELLLPRGTKLRTVSEVRENGARVVHMEVVV